VGVKLGSVFPITDFTQSLVDVVQSESDQGASIEVLINTLLHAAVILAHGADYPHDLIYEAVDHFVTPPGHVYEDAGGIPIMPGYGEA
jgi:hypothetical protein